MNVKASLGFLLFVLIFLNTKISFSQIYHKNQLIELQFISSVQYDNPVKDVTLECSITNGIDTLVVCGFWDGGNIFKVRFSLNKLGKWSYTTKCSNKDDLGLDNKSGNLTITEYTGDNLLYKKGRIKVSPSKRYLVYDDGDPFFYLGDTAWEITWKSYKEQVLQYISDRKRKGYTTIQMVALSHQYLHPYGMRNRYGETTFLNSNYYKINPRYFDYLDFIVKTVNDSGLVIVLCPLWAPQSEVDRELDRNDLYLTKEETLNLAKYISSRYSGFNLVYIIGGDHSYNTIERKKFWTDYANLIKRCSGYQQLCTCHPNGWSASFEFFDNYTTWLDFHMYQSSHILGGDYTWFAAKMGYTKEPPKPVLDGEPLYEDIINNWWDAIDTIVFQVYRMKPIDVRQASYESILSGALVGITYGANGVWQWHTEELPGSHMPRFTVIESLKFHGSDCMTVLRNIMEKYQWYELIPQYDLISEFKSKENFIPVAENQKYGIIYIPKNTEYIKIKLNSDFIYCSYFWLNPDNGTPLPGGCLSTETITPPDSNDWLVIVYKKKYDLINLGWKTINDGSYSSNNYPNPFNSQTTIRFALHEPCSISIKIYDVLGQEVYDFGKQFLDAGLQSVIWKPQNLSSGLYFYRIESETSQKIGKMLYIK